MNNLKLRGKPLITDMDGVLCDSQSIHARIESQVLLEMGVSVSPEEITSRFTGKGTELMFETYLGAVRAKEALAQKNQELSRLRVQDIVEIPGAKDFYLKLVKTATVGLASGSSIDFIKLVLKALDLTESITSLTSGEEVPRAKPHPDIFLLAAKKMSVDPTQCWVIEDSPFGIQSAKEAGMLAIGLTTSYDSSMLDQAGADIVCHSFEEIHERTQVDGK